MDGQAIEIRPSGTTPVASTIIKPVPPVAKAPKCTRCQSPTKPLTAEYWHMGDTQARFSKVTERRVKGSNNLLMGSVYVGPIKQPNELVFL